MDYQTIARMVLRWGMLTQIDANIAYGSFVSAMLVDVDEGVDPRLSRGVGLVVGCALEFARRPISFGDAQYPLPWSVTADEAVAEKIIGAFAFVRSADRLFEFLAELRGRAGRDAPPAFDPATVADIVKNGLNLDGVTGDDSCEMIALDVGNVWRIATERAEGPLGHRGAVMDFVLTNSDPEQMRAVVFAALGLALWGIGSAGQAIPVARAGEVARAGLRALGQLRTAGLIPWVESVAAAAIFASVISPDVPAELDVDLVAAAFTRDATTPPILVLPAIII